MILGVKLSDLFFFGWALHPAVFPVVRLKVMGVCPRIFCGLPLDFSPFPKNGYVGSFESKGRHYSS